MYQNELMQLIQFAPKTKRCFKRPLLIVPPWINKFYILDLRPENSFVALGGGAGPHGVHHPWVNPDARLAQKGFEDYMTEGALAALDAIEQATGEREVNAIGYCLGGTLLAATLAYMAAKSRRADRVGHILRHAAGFLRSGRDRRLHRRGTARGDGEAA